MDIKRFFSFVPNTITSFNAVCGGLSIIYAFEGQLVLSGILILLAAIFDFFDGMSARLLHAYSAMGKELDSLADAISFGLAPAVIAHVILRQQLISDMALTNATFFQLTLIFFPLIISVFSILRLAKFNIDERQSETFIGLATPANAMIWASFPFIISSSSNQYAIELIQNHWFILVLSLVMSLLLVAEIPMFSLKFKNLKFSDNKIRFIFLLISIVLLISLKLIAIPLIIFIYIITSVTVWMLNR